MRPLEAVRTSYELSGRARYHILREAEASDGRVVSGVNRTTYMGAYSALLG